MSELEPTRTHSNPTATEVLRRLLDERGVEWEDASPVPSMKPWKTSFTSFTGEEVTISAYDEPKWLMGTMVFHTPEQAIAATLGAWTCKLMRASWDDDTCTWGCICSACDAHLEHETGIGYNYCPICGRRIEQ